MNTDKEQKLQEGGKEAFLLKEETHAIIGCAFEVLNGLGHGLNEKMLRELARGGICPPEHPVFATASI